MADWGAGYANAASGLASIFMGKAQQNVRGREQAAEEARRLKEQKRQELMQMKELEFRKGESEADRRMRMLAMEQSSKESKMDREFRAQESAAQRGLTQSYYNQMDRNEQARLGLQREEMAQRQGLAQMRAGGEGTKPAASDSILNNIRTEFREKEPEEAYRLAVQKYGQEIADAAFGGVAPVAQDRRNTWQGLGQSLMGGLRSISGQNDDITSILNKYSSN
jgi:hypothetical protein